MAVLRPQPLPASPLLLPTEPSELERFVCGRLQRGCALDGSFAPWIRCARAYPARRLLDREFLIAVVTAGGVRGADLEQQLGFASDFGKLVCGLPAPEGAPHHAALTASLKRCPDTNRCFSLAC